MSVTDTTPRDASSTLTFAFDLKHPPQKVWRALTDPTLLAEWLLPVLDLKLDPGATFTFRRDPMPGWDGVVHCRILEAEPPDRLSYTWVVGELHTVVRFTLTATETGTRLDLEQSGFQPSQKHNLGGARYGWRLMGDKLVALLGRLE